MMKMMDDAVAADEDERQVPDVGSIYKYTLITQYILIPLNKNFMTDSCM